MPVWLVCRDIAGDALEKIRELRSFEAKDGRSSPEPRAPGKRVLNWRKGEGRKIKID